MKKKLIIALCAAVFLVSGALSVYLYNRPGGRVVEIISDGKVLYELDLDKEPDREMTVEYEGRKNVITIEGGDIYVSEAECPDHTCMKMGKLSAHGVPIVCLPNKLIIRYKEGGDTDAAA
ncbi:NusG domain II-containing protein [Ruminococcus sp. NK3A76]|uniref:NusG domain II-containing protein n=1 Tax=Ruminococcus sp. NK3A76 TaxID=877411 RepID=UPI00048EFEDE|nr:NusG domain II-containing protein [Ruminococcus sp. NK3A76]